MKRVLRSKKWTHSLSLCMIVKNEAETLEKCLRLARPFVDEIVVVDTGSTDGTQEIARGYADVYDEIEWPDSFAAARNHSIDLGTSDFILILDGDEYIEDARQWKAMRRALQDGVVGLVLPVYNLLGENGLIRSDRALQRRVFLNRPEIRYTGRVHNQIGEEIVTYGQRHGLREEVVEAEVVHTGYSYDAERMKEKYRPRLNLILEEYENSVSPTEQAYYGFQLGVYYKILEEYERAFEVLNDVNHSLLTSENAFYSHLVAALAAIRLNRYHAATAHCEAMLQISRTEPMAYFVTGLAMFKTGQQHDGLLMTLQAYLTNGAPEGRTARFGINPRSVLRYIAGMCYESGLDRFGKALQALYQRKEADSEQAAQIVQYVQTEVAAGRVAEAA